MYKYLEDFECLKGDQASKDLHLGYAALLDRLYHDDNDCLNC